MSVNSWISLWQSLSRLLFLACLTRDAACFRRFNLNQVLIRKFHLPSFYISATQKWLQNLGGGRVFGNQAVAGGAVNHKRLVQPGLNAIVKSSFHIFPQRLARPAQFRQQIQHFFCSSRQPSLVSAVCGILNLIGRKNRLKLRHWRPRLPVKRRQLVLLAVLLSGKSEMLGYAIAVNTGASPKSITCLTVACLLKKPRSFLPYPARKYLLEQI